MTLIIAQKVEDLIFIYADTFSNNDFTRESINWFQQPMKKIFRLTDRFVVSFSGSSYYMMKMINDAKAASVEEIGDIEELWGRNVEIDLVIIDTEKFNLHRMSERGVENLDACYIGSRSGFEKYQRLRHTDIPPEYTGFYMVRMPEGATPRGHEVFGNAHQAFQAVLFETDGSFGGVPISYVVTPEEQTFGTHCAVYRGPLNEEEVAPGRWTPMVFRDAVEGQFIASIWGSRNTSAIYFPNAMLGFLGSQDQEDTTEYIKYSKTDGYDFTFETERLGVGAGISTWNSWQNEFNEVKQYIQERNRDKANYIINKMRSTITHQLKAWNEKFDEESDNFFKSISQSGAINIDIGMINAISAYYSVKVELLKTLYGAVDKDLSTQKNAWGAMVADLRFQVGARDFKNDPKGS